jgi:hypothetical protein
VASIFDGVAFAAMQTTALMPWMRAARATLRVIARRRAITPRRFSSSESCANLLSGPRILYEPVR